ncbi:hypothetical protein [Streptomyces sp. NPDC012888]|uniref:hypothetical protein n=1 Tax=Streptomyces sp. NPDC012888 TaxID=3364855 RepID=UPI00369F159D
MIARAGTGVPDAARTAVMVVVAGAGDHRPYGRRGPGAVDRVERASERPPGVPLGSAPPAWRAGRWPPSSPRTPHVTNTVDPARGLAGLPGGGW